MSRWEFLTDTQWTPLFADPHYGILPLLSGTLVTAGRAAGRDPARDAHRDLPLRVRAAPVREIVKPMLELLAGVPTIVYGYFALLFVTPLLQKLIPSCRASTCSRPGS